MRQILDQKVIAIVVVVTSAIIAGKKKSKNFGDFLPITAKPSRRLPSKEEQTRSENNTTIKRINSKYLSDESHITHTSIPKYIK